jgi:hypothetical protein
VLTARRPSWRIPHKRDPSTARTRAPALQHHTSSSPLALLFSHPPRPPGSSPCSSAHGRGWEEFSPAGARAGPRAGLGLPKLGLAGLGANLRKRVIQDGCFPMVSFDGSVVLLMRWFCLCDGFAYAMVLLMRWFSFCGFFLCYGFLQFLLVPMYGLSFCTLDAPRCGE